MLSHIELPFDSLFLIVSSQFIVVFTFSHQSIPTITTPTRFPPNYHFNPSLIDHIWLNKPSIYTSGIVLTDFTSHYMTYIPQMVGPLMNRIWENTEGKVFGKILRIIVKQCPLHDLYSHKCTW